MDDFWRQLDASKEWRALWVHPQMQSIVHTRRQRILAESGAKDLHDLGFDRGYLKCLEDLRTLPSRMLKMETLQKEAAEQEQQREQANGDVRTMRRAIPL